MCFCFVLWSACVSFASQCMKSNGSDNFVSVSLEPFWTPISSRMGKLRTISYVGSLTHFTIHPLVNTTLPHKRVYVKEAIILGRDRGGGRGGWGRSNWRDRPNKRGNSGWNRNRSNGKSGPAAIPEGVDPNNPMVAIFQEHARWGVCTRIWFSKDFPLSA